MAVTWIDLLDSVNQKYNNAASGLSADKVQTALDEIDSNLDNHNHDGSYDPIGSAAAVQSNLDAHEGDSSNPHSVTAAQAGAEPYLDNPDSDGYVLSSTVAGVRTWVPQSGGGGDLTDAEFPTYAVFDAKVAAGAAVNFASGNKQETDASANSSITVAAPAGHPGNFMLVILNSGSLVSITSSTEGAIQWDSGTPPSWAGKAVLALYYDGTTWYGSAMVSVA